MSDTNKKMQLQIYSLEEMQRFANLMALAINQSSLIVIFNGELGAGKTTMIRFILQCFGCIDRIKSPTYNIVHEYEFPNRKVYHLDLYRTETEEELVHIGLQDYVSSNDSIVFIEWGANKGITADIVIDIVYNFENESRLVSISSVSNAGLIMLNLLDGMCNKFREIS